LKGPLGRSLSGIWFHTGYGENAYLQAILPSEVFNSERYPSRLTVNVTRLQTVPFLEFVFPILVCGFLLGATLFLKNDSDRGTRIRIYLSILVFAMGFFFSLQNFCPPRSSLCVPELMLVNLMVGSILFTCASIIPSTHAKLSIAGLETDHWELIGLLVLTVFLPFTVFASLGTTRIQFTWQSITIIALAEIGYWSRYVSHICQKILTRFHVDREDA